MADKSVKVAMFDTEDEAKAFIAKANAEDPRTLREPEAAPIAASGKWVVPVRIGYLLDGLRLRFLVNGEIRA